MSSIATRYWFNKEKLQRMLREHGSASIGVAVPPGMPDIKLPPHLAFEKTIMFNVGQALGVPAPVMFDDTDNVIRWTGHFIQHGRHSIQIPYECLMFVRSMAGAGPSGGRRQVA